MKGFVFCLYVCAHFALQVWFTGFSGESIRQLLAEAKRPAESV